MKPPARLAPRLPIKPLLLVLGLAATAYAVALAVFGEGNALATLRRLGSLVGLQAAALCLLNYLLRGLRWRMWMAHHGRALDSPLAYRLAIGGGLVLLALGVLLFVLRQRLALRVSWLRDAWQCLATRPAVWLMLTSVAWAAQGLAVWLLCRDAGLSIGVLQAAGFYAVAMVGGALSLLPAGLGGMEALFTGLLVLHGAGAAQALGITVLVRVLTLWLAVAIGALALVYSAAIRDITFR